MILLKLDSNLYEYQFIDWIKYIYIQLFISCVNIDKLEVVKEFILDKAPMLFDDNEFDIYQICLNSLENSLIIKYNSNYTLKLDPNRKINDVYENNILKMINDGTLLLKPYKIFSDISNYIYDNIDNYYMMYQMGFYI